MKALTKYEICQILRKRGWRRTNWRWTNLKPGYLAIARQGVALREAAGLEALLSSEDLTERRKARTSPTLKQYKEAAARLALSRANIESCARCGWPVWQGERCVCGCLTK